MEFNGACEACGRFTFSFTNGDSDPRGVLGRWANSTLDAREHDLSRDVIACFECRNDGDTYRKLRHLGKPVLKA